MQMFWSTIILLTICFLYIEIKQSLANCLFKETLWVINLDAFQAIIIYVPYLKQGKGREDIHQDHTVKFIQSDLTYTVDTQNVKFFEL